MGAQLITGFEQRLLSERLPLLCCSIKLNTVFDKINGSGSRGDYAPARIVGVALVGHFNLSFTFLEALCPRFLFLQRLVCLHEQPGALAAPCVKIVFDLRVDFRNRDAFICSDRAPFLFNFESVYDSLALARDDFSSTTGIRVDSKYAGTIYEDFSVGSDHAD